MRVAGRREEQHRRVDRAARDDHDIGAEGDGLAPVDAGDHPVDGPAGRVGLQPLDVRVRHHLDVARAPAPGRRRSPARRTWLRSGRGSRRPGRTGCTRWLRVARPSASCVRSTPIGRWNGCRPCFSMSALSCWIARLVLHRRMRVLRAGRALGRVLTVPAAHPVEVLGLGVVRLEVGVLDGPRRRQTAVVPDLPEVLRAGAGTALRRRTSCSRRRSSSPRAGTRGRAASYQNSGARYLPRTKTAVESQLSRSRGK